MFSLFSQAWRSWKSAKTVAVLAIVALAVGIGSTTAIYTVVNAVLLKPLPYKQGDRFVAVYGGTLRDATPGAPADFTSSTYADVVAYKQRTHSFDVFGWFKLSDFNLTSPGQPQHINGIEATPSLVRNLGVSPKIGRWFTANPNDLYSAVISNALWRRLGANPNILGQALTLNGRRYAISGVMPPWFRLPVGGPGNSVSSTRSDVWIPLNPIEEANDRNTGNYFAYARLKPGVTLARARADVKRVAAEIAKADHPDYPYTGRVENLRDVVVSEIRPTLLLLFGAAGLLLLITCANVAGLLVARSVARARETAIRLALGAAQGQLAAQYFSEGLLVALAGAAASVLLSFALVRVVVSLAEEYIPRADEISVDWTVLLFVLGVACLAAVLSSLAPLWQTVRTLPNEVLSDGVRASAGARTRRISQSLVIAEIALAFTLLTASTILFGHLRNLTHINPGFDTGHLLTFELTATDSQYSTTPKLVAYQKRLIEALANLAGVTSAAFVNHIPLEGCCFSTMIFPEGQSVDPKAAQRISFLLASTGYFRTMRLPLRSGRLLNEHDTVENPANVLINQAAARHYWPNRDPVGSLGHFSSPTGDRFQVVGVVGDVRNDGLQRGTVPEVYLSSDLVPTNPMKFVVRSPLPEKTLLPEIRRAIQNVNPVQPIHDIATMPEIVDDSLSLERVSSFMTGFFAGAALLMAALGIYGIVSYWVRQRRVEIGTRMALGAVGRDLFALVIGGGVKMAGWGIGIGAAAVALTSWLLIREFGIRDIGALSFLYSIAIIAALAVSASFFPAWQATLLSPMVAIRDEPRSMWQSARIGIRRAIEGVSHIPLFTGRERELSESALATELVEATRDAESITELFKRALTTLCDKVGCESAMLLGKVSEQEYRLAAAVPALPEEPLILPANGFLLQRLRSYSLPLPLTPGDFETWTRWASEQRPQYLAELHALDKTGVRLAVALRAKRDVIGVLLLGSLIGRPEFTASEKRVLRACAEQFSLMVENARLTSRVIEQEKLRRDLALAAEVQKRLLPEKSPEMSLATIAAFSVPARTVGGDYFDFLQVGDRRIGIALADIAGKGVAAALIMSAVHASLRIIAAEGTASLPELAAKMNRFLYRSTRSSSYATFFYAQVDEENRQLRYVNAGHNPPYLLRSSGPSQIDELSTGGMIIGMFPQASYEEAIVDLRSGDVLIIFTDGVTEALNPEGEEFGEVRLKELLRTVSPLSVEEMSAEISRELRTWISHAEQHDDLTFIVMKVS